MKKRGYRTWVAVLLLISMLVPVFVNLDVHADETVVDSFYILDEEGNPVVIEITQSDLDNFKKEDRAYGIMTVDGAARYAQADRSLEEVIGIVRFNRDVTLIHFTEAETGREGYTSPMTAGDAAYIGTEEDGILCYLSGVRILVSPDDVAEILPFEKEEEGETVKEAVSYYYTTEEYLIHNYTYFNGGETPQRSTTRVGLAPSYLKVGTDYYSYDGHYFYDSFETMIRDYKNNVFDHAVNADQPYYNYYQYLTFHTTADYTAKEYDDYIAEKKGSSSGSAMLHTGSEFLDTQNTYTINSVLMYGIAINESGWGMSTLAKEKNNLFGLNASDSNPVENGKEFSSTAACINDFAYGWMHTGYLDGGDSRYRGPHLGDKQSGIGVKYSSDPYWGEKGASRPYYFDEDHTDYGRYTIGIALSGSIKLYKEADTSSKVIYTSETSSGGDVYDYPVTILDTVKGSDGTVFYKVISDMSLLDDRSARDVDAEFKPSRDYVYAKASDILVVFEGSGENTEIEDPVEKPVFPDVTSDRYSYDAVKWAYENGITLGSTDGYFHPEDNCTREEVVTFLWRTKEKPKPKTTDMAFPDVSPDRYSYDAILWAYENGITVGSNGYFLPEDNCTREEVMTFIWRTEGKPEPKTTDMVFPDVDASRYSYDAILWAYENGITLGSNGYFLPEDNCTREEVVTFLYRAFAE